MFPRNIEQILRTSLSDTPVVLLNGARQTGKSTLANALAKSLSATYVTLDDTTQLAAAKSDPHGFLNGLGKQTVIDEVQKAPDLFPAIKMAVDQDRRPGRFLLTGSANVLLLPKISESLAGRMELITLWPLSQGEMDSREERFIDGVFSEEMPELIDEDEKDLFDIIVKGGYPEVVQRITEERRNTWFEGYITALLQRDVRDMSNIDGLTEMPRLLSLLASRLGGLLNISELSRSSGIANTTLKRYLSLLQATFLYQPLLPWSVNIGKRLVKSSKIHLIDSGMATYLTGFTREIFKKNPTFFGHLLETFVVGELRKQLGWSNKRVNLFHYRTSADQEVDIVMTDATGQLVGIEVKASSTIKKKDFRGLEALAHDTADQFLRGIVLYAGSETANFGKRFTVAPISALWRMRA